MCNICIDKNRFQYLCLSIERYFCVFIIKTRMNLSDVSPLQIYQYFRDCYKLDYKEFSVDNILSAKYKFKWFVKGEEELFNERLPRIPYDNPKIEDLEKEIELFKFDKQLFYSCFFVLGKSDNLLVNDKRVCAPLLFFPANIVTIDGLKYLEIERENCIVNRSILTKFEVNEHTLEKEEFIQDVLEKMEVPSYDGSFWLKGLIDKYFGNVQTEELLLTPKVWSIQQIRAYLSKVDDKENNEYSIVPGAATVWVEKSQSSLGVLKDLEELKNSNEFNSSQFYLIKEIENISKLEESILRFRLNEQQHKAVKNALSYSNSILIGPPGTGKSYTISSLVADAVLNDKSVLVVSKTKQAVEVIREMLENDFNLKNNLVHTTGNKFKISLKSKIQKILAGISEFYGSKEWEHSLPNLYQTLSEHEHNFLSFIDKEMSLSNIEFSDHERLFDKWRMYFIKRKMGSGYKVWDLYGKIEEYNTKLNKEFTTYCHKKIDSQIRKCANMYRTDIALLYDVLDASSFSESQEIGSKVNYQNILKVFPIWLANLSDLNSVLPLQKDLFDLVIIDEATQCDIASALPSIYRAKRVLISGDPNQLKHYSFVSRNQQNDLLRKYSLPSDKIFDYRDRSILDFFLFKIPNQDQVTFLKEHFRSTPSLIEFSNKHFYEGQLQVLKSLPNHTKNSHTEVIQVNGQRDKKGINIIEAQVVVDKIEELVLKYKGESVVPDIGVISLFSAQASYLNRLIKDKFDIKTIKKFNILCSSPYVFQGNEREIMFLSFALDDSSHHSAFIHANKPEVLNVAITRAKSFQYVFTSMNDSNLNKESLLAEYFSFLKEFTIKQEDDVEEDEFQQQVVEALQKKGLETIYCGYPLGGCLLDILVINKKGISYFIDLIGYPGMFKESYTLERYKTLGRMGIRIIPLHYSFWQDDSENITEALYKRINLN